MTKKIKFNLSKFIEKAEIDYDNMMIETMDSIDGLEIPPGVLAFIMTQGKFFIEMKLIDLSKKIAS